MCHPRRSEESAMHKFVQKSSSSNMNYPRNNKFIDFFKRGKKRSKRSFHVCFAELSLGSCVLRDHDVLLGFVGQYTKTSKKGLAVRTVLLGLHHRSVTADACLGAHTWKPRNLWTTGDRRP